jgi:hypothetical protein
MSLQEYPLGAVQFIDITASQIAVIPLVVAEILREDDEAMLEIFHLCVERFGLYK